MQAKLIKSIISRKIKLWADEVAKDNEEVAKAIRENTVVMGGSICSMLMGEKPNDYDVYFRTEAAAHTVASYYLKKFMAGQKEKEKRIRDTGETFIPVKAWIEPASNPDGFKSYIKSAGVMDERSEKAYQYFETHTSDEVHEFFGTDDENLAAGADLLDNVTPEDPEGAVDKAKRILDTDKETKQEKFRPVYITQNAITLSDDIQIVTRFFGEPEKILEYYDYEHCKMYYQSWDGFLKLGEKALECLINKRLDYTGSYYPICSLFRMRKFMGRGWHINAGQIVKMAWQIHKLNLNDPKVLEEQLIGVDHAYFVEIINLLKKKQEDDGNKSIDETYLMQLLEKFF